MPAQTEVRLISPFVLYTIKYDIYSFWDKVSSAITDSWQVFFFRLNFNAFSLQ